MGINGKNFDDAHPCHTPALQVPTVKWWTNTVSGNIDELTETWGGGIATTLNWANVMSCSTIRGSIELDIFQFCGHLKDFLLEESSNNSHWEAWPVLRWGEKGKARSGQIIQQISFHSFQVSRPVSLCDAKLFVALPCFSRCAAGYTQAVSCGWARDIYKLRVWHMSEEKGGGKEGASFKWLPIAFSLNPHSFTLCSCLTEVIGGWCWNILWVASCY